MKKTLIAAAALVAMAGCNKSLIESSPAVDSNYGYINLGVSADTEMVVTKAATAVEGTDLNPYTVTVTKENVADPVINDKFENVTSWKVAAGKYTVAVQNLTVAEAYTSDNGALRVAGSSEVDVESGLEASCTVACTPVNSKVSFDYTDAFAKIFDVTNAALKVTNQKSEDYPARTIDMTMATSAEAAEVAFVEPLEHNWALTVSSALNGSKNYTKPFTPTEGAWTQITFDVSETDGSIKVSVTVDDEIKDVYTITATVDPTEDNDVTVTNPEKKNL